jgi:hypothetical protein
MDDPRNYDFPTGFGSAFIEFTSMYEAKRARRGIHLARYGSRMVECAYHDEGKFERNDFSLEETIKVEKPSGEFEGLEKFAIDFQND